MVSNNAFRGIYGTPGVVGCLMFARWNSSSGLFDTEMVDDGSSDVGEYCSLALDGSDLPQISYVDA